MNERTNDQPVEPVTAPDADEVSRRRRIAEVFGDVLPDTTSDERDPGSGEGSTDGEDPRDAWYRAQVPPHHG
jgi:hypothetical protein